MMNFDDQYTKGFEETFQKYLKEIRSMKPENFEKIKEAFATVSKIVSEYEDMPEKSPEDLKFLSELEIKLKQFAQKIADMKLILDVSLHRQALAYYDNVKNWRRRETKRPEKSTMISNHMLKPLTLIK